MNRSSIPWLQIKWSYYHSHHHHRLYSGCKLALWLSVFFFTNFPATVCTTATHRECQHKLNCFVFGLENRNTNYKELLSVRCLFVGWLLIGMPGVCPDVLMFCMFLTTIIILLMQRMCKKLITIPDVTWAGGWMSFSHTRNRCEAVTGRVWIVGRFKILIEIHCPLQFYSQTLCCSWAFAQIWFRWICGLEAYGSTQMLKKKDMNHRLAVYYNKFTSDGEFHRKYLLTFLSSYLPT